MMQRVRRLTTLAACLTACLPAAVLLAFSSGLMPTAAQSHASAATASSRADAATIKALEKTTQRQSNEEPKWRTEATVQRRLRVNTTATSNALYTFS